jgi:hypothetical protein
MDSPARLASAPAPDRFLIGIIAGALALIAIAAALVALGRSAPAPPVDPASPVGIVQAYIEAVRAGDVERAHGYLSRGAQAAVPLTDYRKAFAPGGRPDRGEQRLVIEPVAEAPARAEVRVTISRLTVGEGPFAAGSYHYEVMVVLVREDGAWRVDLPAEPYPFLP